MTSRGVSHPVIPPPATIGILGGGQLGRMFVAAAREMGYRTAVLDPDPASPAGQIADRHLCSAYEDEDALDTLAETCAAVTVEFESVPSTSLERLRASIPVSPSPTALSVAQERVREKKFIGDAGAATVNFEDVPHPDAAEAAVGRLSKRCAPPYLLKAARWGYDGKHQQTVATAAEIEAAMKKFGGGECILEERIELEREVSVMIVRGGHGEAQCYPLAENEHRNGILHLSAVPARLPEAVGEQVRADACGIAAAMDYCGVLGVEFFITADGRILVNEIAPRPHNSGHYTIDACVVSQFTQQARMMCGLPTGDTRLLSPVVMVNLLGDLWQPHRSDAGEPEWDILLSRADVRLHLYGKAEARAGRKMGHFCMLGDDVDRLREEASALHRELQRAAAGSE